MTEHVKPEQLEEAVKALGAARERFAEVEKKYGDQQKAFDKLDAIDIDLLKKTGAEVADLMEKFSKSEAERKAEADRVADIEKHLAAGIVADEKGVSKEDKADDDRMAFYLKHGEKHREFAEKSFGDHEAIERAAVRYVKAIANGATKDDAESLKKTLISGSNPDGGYFVPVANARVINGRIFETSPVRRVATVISTQFDEVPIVLDDDEAESGWVGETDSRGDTGTPQVGEIKIPVHELYAQPKLSQRLMDDAAFNVTGWLQGKVADKFARAENSAFVSGDGVLKPRGFLTYAAWAAAGVYQRNAIEQIVTGANAGYTGDQLKRIQNSLKEAYQPGAVWGMKRASFWYVQVLKDADGRYMLGTDGGLSTKDEMRLLGKEVVFMDDMPLADAAGKKSLVYGNFRDGYTVADRIGIRILRDPYTAKPYIRFYTTKRVGGAVTNFEALKIGVQGA